MKAPQYKQEYITNLYSKSKSDSTHDMLKIKSTFYSLFSTFVWFLDHYPNTNVAMNLDVNF